MQMYPQDNSQIYSQIILNELFTVLKESHTFLLY